MLLRLRCLSTCARSLTRWQLVTDLNKFQPGSPPGEELLFVLETFPGKVSYADYSDTLFLGQFPSYNLPFLPDTAQYAGYTLFPNDARASIFRRDSAAVNK